MLFSEDILSRIYILCAFLYIVLCVFLSLVSCSIIIYFLNDLRYYYVFHCCTFEEAMSDLLVLSKGSVRSSICGKRRAQRARFSAE